MFGQLGFASNFVSFLLAVCVVCAYFCLATAFVSFLLAFCVVCAMSVFVKSAVAPP